jgi:chemotaxis protein MotB
MAAKAPIIVIKKKGGHGGHHGGAWKVAYADFVTAMMALFIVLWLLSSKDVQQAVGGYFRDPTGTSKKIGSTMEGAGESFTVSKDNMAQLKDELQQTIRQVPNFDKLKSHIDMTITSEGLRIELMESATSTFSIAASPNRIGTARTFSLRWRRNWARFRTKSRLRGTRIPNPIRGKGTIPIGSFRWTAPTPRAGSCRRTGFETTRSCRYGDTPTSTCASRRIRSTRPTGAFP